MSSKGTIFPDCPETLLRKGFLSSLSTVIMPIRDIYLQTLRLKLSLAHHHFSDKYSLDHFNFYVYKYVLKIEIFITFTLDKLEKHPFATVFRYRKYCPFNNHILYEKVPSL